MLISFNDDLLERFDPRPEDKDELVALNAQLFQFSKVAQREGFLSLDDEIHWVTDPLLRFGLRSIVDGIFDGEGLKAWLMALLVSETRTGKALIRQLMISEGLLAIYKGEDPELCRLLMSAYLGSRMEALQ